MCAPAGAGVEEIPSPAMRLPARQLKTMAGEGREVSEQRFLKQRRFATGMTYDSAGVAGRVVFILARESALFVAD